VEDLESIGNSQVRAICELKSLTLARKLVLQAPSFGRIDLVTDAARTIQENR
jgi:5-methylthioribose kinase